MAILLLSGGPFFVRTSIIYLGWIIDASPVALYYTFITINGISDTQDPHVAVVSDFRYSKNVSGVFTISSEND